MAGSVHKLAAHGVVRKGGPSVVREILTGLTLGAAGGFLWKMEHWNVKRKTAEFYDGYEKGEFKVSKE